MSKFRDALEWIAILSFGAVVIVICASGALLIAHAAFATWGWVK